MSSSALPGDPYRTPPPSSASDVPHLSVAGMRKLLRDEPDVWVQHDSRNRWFCPHCGEIIKSIALPPDRGLALLHDLPFHIVEHLALCAALKAGLPATKRLASNSSAGGMRQALHDARLRQRHTLRKPPTLKGYDIACLYRPMEEVGGDFYEFTHPPGGGVGIGIGDASGHGVESCMLMAVTKKMFSIYGRNMDSPKACLCAVNREVHEEVMQGVFISAGYVVLKPAEGLLTYLRAGHPPPVIYNPRRNPQVIHLSSNGLALGIDSGARFDAVLEEKEIQLLPGDLLVLYTDGLIELSTSDKKEIGIEGFIELLKKYYDRSVEDMVGQIWYAAEKLFSKTRQADDITMVAVKVLDENAAPKRTGSQVVARAGSGLKKPIAP